MEVVKLACEKFLSRLSLSLSLFLSRLLTQARVRPIRDAF